MTEVVPAPANKELCLILSTKPYFSLKEKGETPVKENDAA